MLATNPTAWPGPYNTDIRRQLLCAYGAPLYRTRRERVHAPIERCFLLSTSVEIAEQELRMHPIRGRTSDLVIGEEKILWKGWQLGLPHFHESIIENYRPPIFFRDRMIAGRFAAFEHDHNFTEQAKGAVLLRIKSDSQ
jgi:ligand-binding SRPBCC domain-containing protein